MNLSAILVAALVPLFIAGFVVFWCLICWVISRVGSWDALAQRFPAGPALPEGMRWHYMQTLEMGASQYNGAVTVGVAPTGLYLSTLLLFRPGHVPLLIPWNAITRVKSEKRFWLTGYELSIPLEKFNTVTITLYSSSLAAAIVPYLTHVA